MAAALANATIKCHLAAVGSLATLFCLLVCCVATQPPPPNTSGSTKEEGLLSRSGSTQPPSIIDVELPQPIVGTQPVLDRSPDNRTEVSPRRHKTRRKGNGNGSKTKPKKRKTTMQTALQTAARKGLEAMIELYDRREPEILKQGAVLAANDPGSLLAQFSASNQTEMDAKAAYASLVAAKKFKESTNVEYVAIGRQAPPKISLKKTPLEKMCPSRDSPRCVPASLRYRTHDGTCNNARRPRWGSAQMPFNRFLAPEYQDGVEGIRRSVTGASLPSARFVSLVVHGSRDEEAPVTMMLALWGQLIDHDLTATAQPRSINGSTPRCCNGGEESTHPSCLPIKVPHDDPWLSHLGVRCLEFLRSAPAQRRDCLLSWREQTNQATAYLDASPIYSSNPRSSDNARIFRQGMLLFGRGPPHEDVCFRAALANQCIRPGDSRSGEQPGLLMMHMVWVNEHNQIATRLATLNPHWSDEKVYQEARRIVGALFQHITFREFLPLVLGRDVCRLFDLELETSGHYRGYDANVNPTVANEFAAAAFRFGHSLIQHTYMRADRHHRFIGNNVSLHEDTSEGDFGGPGSLHRLLRGMVNQRALKRDEFITPELTNHLFQTKSFPFGLDLAAINIQRGRDHGLPAYVSWRGPCGLSSIRDWDDLDRIMGPASTTRLRKAYRTVDDIDLFVGGLAERPVVGGIVGPTFACIIAQQFSNLRKGDRFWYENAGFESSFTPAQLESVRQVAFSQVLCRALGGGGSLQPFVFLPPDFGQNERLPCDARLMAPIDLDPWTERDPFTNTDTDSEDEDEDDDNDGGAPAENSPSATDLLTAQSTFSAASTTTTTTRRPPANVVNKVDLVTNGNTGLQQQPRPTTITKGQPATLAVAPTVLVSNKLDLSHQPTNRPAAGATAVDNKLDLKGTTKPTTPAATKRKPTRKPTTTKKRPSASLVVNNNLDFSATRSANATLTDTRTPNRRTKRAANPDARHGYYQTPPPTGYGDYDDEDYDSDYGPPYLAYGYHRPTTPTTTAQTPPPYGYYYTAPPTPPPQPPYPYLDTRRPNHGTRTTPRRRLSDKLTLTHDPLTNQPQPGPQRRRTTSRPDDDAQTPNKPFKKPSATAHSSVFSVDFRALATNRRRTLHANHYQSSAVNGTTVTTLLSDLPTKLSESFSVDDYDDQDIRLTPTDNKLTSSKQDFGGPVPDDHDGYLRPEQTHFEPLVRQTATAQTYRDYWTTRQTDRRHYRDYYTDHPNGLHHGDVPQTVRYASAYDKPLLLDDYSDKFVGLLRDEEASTGLLATGTTGPTNRHDTSKERSIRTEDTKDTDRKPITRPKDKRPTNHRLKVPGGKPSSISLVPFVLLTNIDRPDNWVMYHSKPSKNRKSPSVPLLKSDIFSLNELPTPIVGPD